MTIRAELFSLFNQMTTMRGLIMVFPATMPALVCFVSTACEIPSNQSGPPPWQ